MRVLASILALTLPLGAAAAARDAADVSAAALKTPSARVSDRCGSGQATVYSPKRHSPSTRPLGKEPPAARLYALHREVNGCPAPIVLRKGIGANPDKQLPITGAAQVKPLHH